MDKKTTTLYVRDIDDDFMQLVREFAVTRRISIKALVLTALDQYITRYGTNKKKQHKEVESYGNTRR